MVSCRSSGTAFWCDASPSLVLTNPSIEIPIAPDLSTQLQEPDHRPDRQKIRICELRAHCNTQVTRTPSLQQLTAVARETDCGRQPNCPSIEPDMCESRILFVAVEIPASHLGRPLYPVRAEWFFPHPRHFR